MATYRAEYNVCLTGRDDTPRLVDFLAHMGQFFGSLRDPRLPEAAQAWLCGRDAAAVDILDALAAQSWAHFRPADATFGRDSWGGRILTLVTPTSGTEIVIAPVGSGRPTAWTVSIDYGPDGSTERAAAVRQAKRAALAGPPPERYGVIDSDGVLLSSALYYAEAFDIALGLPSATIITDAEARHLRAV